MTTSGETQHGEERRGGFREAVNELFGRGERGDADDERAREQDAPTARTETVTPETVRQGGDPTAQGAVQHGGEYRGDPDLPSQAPYGGPTEHGGGQAQYGGPTYSGSTATDAGDAELSGGAHRSADDLRADDTRADDTRADDDLTDRVDRSPGQYADGTAATEPAGDPATAATLPREATTTDLGERRVSDDPMQADHGAAPRPTSTSEQGVPAGLRDDDAVGSSAATPSTPATTPTPATPATPVTNAASAGAPSAPGNLPDPDSSERAALVTPDRARSYSTRWDQVKGEFVDEPRRAVRGADALVGELLDELQGLFKAQRSEIERGLDNDETSTEDLRVALRRYRSFFDRLLSI